MPAWNPLLTLPPRPLALLGVLALWLGLGTLDLAWAQVPYDNLWTPPAQGDLFGVGGVECTNLSGLLLERSCPWP